MSKPHKHAELIKAWADGAEIEVYQPAFGRWEKAEPTWHTSFEYRIKPEPKPDVVIETTLGYLKNDDGLEFLVDGNWKMSILHEKPKNIRLTFDGETGELKSAEVLK